MITTDSDSMSHMCWGTWLCTVTPSLVDGSLRNRRTDFAAEFLMPAHQIREHLPTAMGGNAWAALAKLKEQWGVSMQALLTGLGG
jgi:hypothetical protein